MTNDCAGWRLKRSAREQVLHDRYVRQARLARRSTDPLGLVPIIGDYLRVFWYLVLMEKDPRNGLIFSYLNDGLSPTVWHTAIQVIRPDGHPDVGIWVGGAPRSAAHAKALRAEHEARRAKEEAQEATAQEETWESALDWEELDWEGPGQQESASDKTG